LASSDENTHLTKYAPEKGLPDCLAKVNPVDEAGAAAAT
jgi:hypothetical protein